MTERERLVELLKTPHKAEQLRQMGVSIGNYEDDCIEAMVADFLIANGVIVPPCKVGDRVYVDGDTWGYGAIYYENRFIHSKYFLVGEIVSIIKTKKQLLIKIRVSNSIHSRYRHKRYTVNAIGKTVFFTYKEAEKALAERSNDAINSKR